jgi:hypothetical protein
MACLAVVVVALAITSLPAGALRDVPKGECYDCEVTCFEDCALKYDREIIQPDNAFLQVQKANRTAELTEQYGKCLKEDNCPCPKAAAQAKGKTLELVAGGKKGKCAAGTTPCSAKCGQKVVDVDIAKLTKEAAPAKTALLQKDFPLHSVKINAFAKGKMTLDHCLKYCLAATCGCDDAPGVEAIDSMNKLVKQNAAAGAVTDTPKTAQYRPAKIEECAKGMIGKKVASGLYIKVAGGPGGMSEVCSKDFLTKLLGPSGDIDGMTAKCKSGASDDSKYGCLWDAEKNACIVGFSPIQRCQVQYHRDSTF